MLRGRGERLTRAKERLFTIFQDAETRCTTPGCALFFIIDTDSLKLYYRSSGPFVHEDNPG
jgi:hypothetical protein